MSQVAEQWFERARYLAELEGAGAGAQDAVTLMLKVAAKVKAQVGDPRHSHRARTALRAAWSRVAWNGFPFADRSPAEESASLAARPFYQTLMVIDHNLKALDAAVLEQLPGTQVTRDPVAAAYTRPMHPNLVALARGGMTEQEALRRVSTAELVRHCQLPSDVGVTVEMVDAIVAGLASMRAAGPTAGDEVDVCLAAAAPYREALAAHNAARDDAEKQGKQIADAMIAKALGIG
jgi:hypothetical protein